MKAVCDKCRYEISGASRQELDDNFRGHSETFGHMKFYVVDYD